MGICILGMGDCDSVQKTDITSITNNNTDINNSIRNQINQDCSQQISQDNTINIVGSTVKKLSASQKNSVQSMCIMQSILKSSVSADVKNRLLDKIKANIETTGALLGSPSKNETISKSITTNSNKIDNSKFNEISKKCIVDLKQANLLNIIGSNIEDTTTDQANEAFLKCLSQHSDDTQITADALTDTQKDFDLKASAQGGDVFKSAGSFIGSILGSLTTGPMISLIAGIVCLCFILIIFVIFMQ